MTFRGELLVAGNCPSANGPLPVAPDAIEQLHKGEGQIQTQEEEQVPRRLVSEYRPEGKMFVHTLVNKQKGKQG